MKTIASLELGQSGEILERLRKHGIPAKIETVTQESGLAIQLKSQLPYWIGSFNHQATRVM